MRGLSCAFECGKGHVFEAWFKDSATFERQHKRGLVTCAVCGSTKTKKAIMAPRLGGGKAEAEPVAQVPVVPAAAERKVALANDPAVILADEPTGSLDSKSSGQVFDLLREIVDRGKTVIAVTHDLDMAARMDRQIVLIDGAIATDRTASGAR